MLGSRTASHDGRHRVYLISGVSRTVVDPLDRRCRRRLHTHPPATATVDRLMHHAHIVVTQGDSYRLTQATSGQGVKPFS
ncbi:hypothetical protein AQJ46_43820 [Streptomyces canus]|uniref:IstB-like ATP-binding domain-containing protein n=1 Tax=Streptomyces canus TaxID=58343 RepID=A0A124HVE0_9ACTN|nr:hypothetical protein AQJ46_43820 [Streptomyces canus]